MSVLGKCKSLAMPDDRLQGAKMAELGGASLRARVEDLSTLVCFGDLPPAHQVLQMGERFT